MLEEVESMTENITKIPENDCEVKEILRKQIALLAEESETYKDEPELVVSLSNAMEKIASALFAF